MLILRPPKTSQPQQSVPASAEWLRLYAPQVAGADLARGGRPLQGSPTITTAGGRAFQVNTSSVLTAGEMLPGISSGITVLFYAQKLGGNITASDFVFGEQETATGQYNYGFYESGSSGDLVFFVHNGATGVNAGGGTAWRSGQGPQLWVGTYGDGDNNIRMYLDGAQVGVAAQTGNIQRVTSALLRSCFWSGGTPNFALITAGVLPRRMSAAEVARLGRSPWQLFAPEPRRLWVPSAAPATPVLSAATALNITTTTADLRVTVTI